MNIAFLKLGCPGSMFYHFLSPGPTNGYEVVIYKVITSRYHLCIYAILQKKNIFRRQKKKKK